MKKLLFLLSISILGLFACNKDQETVKQPAKNVKEALARISAVSTWKVNQITLDGRVFKNKILTVSFFDKFKI